MTPTAAIDERALARDFDLRHLNAAFHADPYPTLLAVPHEERGPLREWSLAILGALEPALNAQQLERGNRAVTEFVHYLEDLVARRRATPGDPQHDAWTSR